MKTTKQKKRRYLRSRITQNLIINTAEKVFLEMGYHKATITEISKQANVGYGTVYSHFKGKDDLLNKIIERIINNFLEILDDTPPINSIENFNLILNTKVNDYLKKVSENRAILKILLEAVDMSEEINNFWRDKINGIIKVTYEIVKIAQKNKIIKKDIDLEIATKIFGLTMERILREVVYDPDIDLDKLAKTITRIFVSGFSGPAVKSA